MSSVERTVLHPQAANSIGRISSFLFIMHLAFESVRGRRRDSACASRADSSGRAIATAAASKKSEKRRFRAVRMSPEKVQSAFGTGRKYFSANVFGGLVKIRDKLSLNRGILARLS